MLIKQQIPIIQEIPKAPSRLEKNFSSLEWLREQDKAERQTLLTVIMGNYTYMLELTHMK